MGLTGCLRAEVWIETGATMGDVSHHSDHVADSVRQVIDWQRAMFGVGGYNLVLGEVP